MNPMTASGSTVRSAAIMAAGAVLCVLALLAGSRASRESASAELSFPQKGVSQAKLGSPQEAAATLLPNFFRTIPLSTFGGNTAGLAIGVKLDMSTNSGKKLIGTVVGIGEKDVVVRIESWKSAP